MFHVGLVLLREVVTRTTIRWWVVGFGTENKEKKKKNDCAPRGTQGVIEYRVVGVQFSFYMHIVLMTSADIELTMPSTKKLNIGAKESAICSY